MENKQKLGLFSVVAFMLSGLLGIDALAPAAGIGPSVFGWWLLVIGLFVVPYALIVCELSAAYPGTSIYEWVLRGMGKRNAARVSWYYWINVPFWMPSIFLICGGMLAELFWPEMSTWGICSIAIVMVWATIFVANASLDFGKIINAIGSFSKVAILLAFVIGGYLLTQDQPLIVNEINLDTMTPSMEDTFTYAPTLIYMFLGVEIIACMGPNIQRPERNIPLGIFISLAIIIVLYGLAAFAMLIAIPEDQLSLVAGLVQTLKILYGDSAFGQFVTIALSLLATLGLFTYLTPWVMAVSRAAAEAANDNEMPAIFAKTNKAGAPYGANMLTGIIATIALVLLGMVSGSADDLFWALFSFANVLCFVAYIFFFVSFLRLRQKEPEIVRPFKIPGGTPIAALMALIPAAILAISGLLFVFPDILSGVIDWDYSSPTVYALVIALLVIEVSISKLQSNQKFKLASSNG
ncbi:APC family permease [Vibrio hippocampi]|uniref:Glutamate/gamma-aminobutyrate antiporter n=1 Tax=Vibrio hippocampi TaxID=654686 RepID=A0ABN8DNC9_9VIBR|nr:APC family permease [Vibrio hippocampi]CAH0530422.1 putative glutamate/gamma-aminobutyrate antiporter [Vibrio hippocampi]